MSEQQPVRIVVHPLPADAEAAVITAAVSMTISAEAEPGQESVRKDAWRQAGKREALRDRQWETTT
ncbi:MAG: hypothetical protein M9934_05145 [Thermomicrobiales bacterium]|nr:hypothetical protein [Thermomicrobiales bacterium]MCO5227654.1 hypothetical protein [Thermomicrobiales bacterium]